MLDEKREIRFGALAVKMEFITAAQLGMAVSTQMKEDLAYNKHRLLGEVLVDMGLMDSSQVDKVLRVFKQHK
jgi:hypothetical protein